MGWQQYIGNPGGSQAGQGQHMQRSAMQGSQSGPSSAQRSEGQHTDARTGGGCPLSKAQPQGLLMLGLEQVYCELSWQKLCGEAG